MMKSFAVCVMSFCFVAMLVVTASAKGGVGGGGDPKPVSIRWTGTITAITPIDGGYSVTLGTSYYAVGTGTVNADTKIKLNGSSSSYTGADLRVGDLAQMDVLWPSRIATKMEVSGIR